MFDWFYNKIADSIILRLEAWLSDPKNIQQLTNLIDSMADREIKRVIQSFSGAQKGGILPEGTESPKFDISRLMSGRGGLSSKKIIGQLIGGWIQGAMSKGSESAPSSGQQGLNKKPYDY